MGSVQIRSPRQILPVDAKLTKLDKMNFDPSAALNAARRASALTARRAEFGWDGTAPAPVDGGGLVVFRTADPAHSLAMETPFDNQIGVVIRRFVPAFMAFSISKGIVGYQEKIAEAMQTAGMSRDDSVILVRLSWVVILDGLSSLCESLDKWFNEAGGESPVPLAPLHLWALGEASACYLIHLDPSASAPPVAADAKFLDKYFGNYCTDFNAHNSPYTSLSIIPQESKQNAPG
jgi:hypothetical protein